MFIILEYLTYKRRTQYKGEGIKLSFDQDEKLIVGYILMSENDHEVTR